MQLHSYTFIASLTEHFTKFFSMFSNNRYIVNNCKNDVAKETHIGTMWSSIMIQINLVLVLMFKFVKCSSKTVTFKLNFLKRVIKNNLLSTIKQEFLNTFLL